MNVGDNNGNAGFLFACRAGKLNVVQFLVKQGFEVINELNFNGGKTGLEMLISMQFTLSRYERFLPCLLLLIEAGAQLNACYVFEELHTAAENRIFEITFMEKTIFEKWTGRIAQAITDFTIDPFTSTSLQNLSQFFD